MTVLHRNFIGGESLAVETGDRIKVYNPARDTMLAEIPDTPAEIVDRAVQAAKKAQKGWAKLPAIQRANALRRISAKIRENADKIAHVISEEQGKVLPLAKVEAAFTADYLDYMAEWARRIEGEILESDRPGETILFSASRSASSPAYCRGTSRSSSSPASWDRRSFAEIRS